MRRFAVFMVLLLATAGAPAAEDITGLADHHGKPFLIKKAPEGGAEFAGIDLVLSIRVAAQTDNGTPPDLEAVKKLALLVTETDRERGYVHFWIGLKYLERKDYARAAGTFKAGLPLAGKDRSHDSLYVAILRGLLYAYEKDDRFAESLPYLKIYRDIVSAGVDPWQRFDGSEDVAHKPSGIRLPHKLGAFTRNRLTVYDDTGRDAGANYVSDDGAHLTVYLVADYRGQAEASFGRSMGLILRRFKGSSEVSRGPFSVATANGKIEGWAGRVRVPAAGNRPPALSGVPLLSELYVFKRAGTLIKFRLTYRESDRNTVAGQLKIALERFDWP